MKIHDASGTRPMRWLYLGFVLTGIGTTLLGCILPSLITIWRINDAHAGLLFAAQFSGSTLGAVLVSHNYFSSLMRGYVLLTGSALTIAYFAGSSQVLPFLVFGLGLGLTMTATSMLTGSMFPERRGAALSLLNAYWVLGAIVCPATTSLWLKRWAPANLFFVLALAVAFVFLLIRRRRLAFTADTYHRAGTNGGPLPLRLISIFALLSFLYVGVEVSVGGWMMSYIHRLSGSSKTWPAVGASCFWVALLCGRAIAPRVLRRISEAELLTVSVTVAFISVLLLLVNHAPFRIVLSATSSGLALGPIFPLCLARVLAWAQDSPKTKWVFAIAGLGGAVMPWLTGRLSAHSGSLGIGLVVPLFALGVMLVLQLCITQGLDQSLVSHGAE